jgi:4-amino-4-deoxy-L-arabinose transferase-like glycosyltransferase
MYLLKDKPLLFLVISGLILRLLGLINIRLRGDFAYHWSVAGDIIHKGFFPLLGPGASINSQYHLGPFYYYLLAIPYLLGNGNFQAAIIFFSFLNTINIILLYIISKKLFDEKQSLIITAMYTFSNYMLTIGNFPWNPYVLPFFILLSLLSLIRIQEGKYIYTLLLFLSFSISLQLHGTAIFLFPVFLVLLPLKKIPLKFIFSGLILGILVALPWLYFDFSTHFSQSKEFLNIFSPQSQQCSFIPWLQNHGHGERCFSQIRNTIFAFRFIIVSITNSTNIFVVLVGLILTVGLLFMKKIPQKKLMLIWLIFPIFCFLFYSSNIYLHYYLILFPIPFFIYACLLKKIESFGKWGKILSLFIFVTTLLINVIEYLFSLGTIRG